MESKIVIYIHKEKINVLNEYRYWVCIGRVKNDNLEEMAKIGRPYSDFAVATLKAIEWSNDTKWPYINNVDVVK